MLRIVSAVLCASEVGKTGARLTDLWNVGVPTRSRPTSAHTQVLARDEAMFIHVVRRKA